MVAIILVISVLCCCLVTALLAGGAAIYYASKMIPTGEFEFSATISVPGFNITAKTPTPPSPVVIETNPVSPGALETLNTLKNEIVPINDPRDLGERLGGKSNIPETVDPAPAPVLNEHRQFWVSNVDTNENFQIEAVLRYVGDHSYFWIEDGVSYDEGNLEDLANTFDSKTYNTNREFFGSEWNPGVDHDPRLYVLFARGLGGNLAGYFSSADELHPLAHEYSNGHEMFLMNADNVDLGEEFTYGVLAHEFQHMIHWYRDRNEESWLNEGFSELAAFLNGYDAGGFDYSFASNPDLQLNDWPNDQDATTPHYGAAFLFVTYFLDRFGEEATQALVDGSENGMDSVDTVLKQLNFIDPQTNKPVLADDVFSDWVVTNFIQDESFADGRYDYQRYTSPPEFTANETIENCNVDWKSTSVNQYAADYYRLNCAKGTYRIQFQGSSEVGVLPQSAHSGSFAFWSNKGDESDMRLTREFDFEQLTGPVTLQYQVWYDLEEDYDYLYLVASEDDGVTWSILKTPSGTDQDPSGNSYGWGYNGVTDGWIEETVDLSQYAGKKILLRFEYVTDAAVNGEGLLLDDVSIPQLSYSTDFEDGDGGWVSDGFVRIENRLPQIFRVQLIKQGQVKAIETFEVQPGDPLSIPVTFDQSMDEAVLVVSGTTRFTRQVAGYKFKIE